MHLLIADTGVGLPLPVHAVKTKLRLADRVDATGRLAPEGRGTAGRRRRQRRRGVDRVTVCPWASREGILIRRLESPDGWRDRGADLALPPPRAAVPVPAPVPVPSQREAGDGATVVPLSRKRA